MTLDGYNQTYSSAEVSEVSTDLIVEIGSQLVPFVAIIVIIIIYKLVTKKR